MNKHGLKVGDKVNIYAGDYKITSISETGVTVNNENDEWKWDDIDKAIVLGNWKLPVKEEVVSSTEKKYKVIKALPDIAVGTIGEKVAKNTFAFKTNNPSIKVRKYKKATLDAATEYFSLEYDFKDGDYVVVIELGDLGHNRGTIGQIKGLQNNENYLRVEKVGGSSFWHRPKNLRFATPEEIASVSILKLSIGTPVAEVEISKDGKVTASVKGNRLTTNISDIVSLRAKVSGLGKLGSFDVVVDTLRIGCKEVNFNVTAQELNKIICEYNKFKN